MAENTSGEIVNDQEALKSGHDAPGLWLRKIERAKKDESDWHKNALEAVAIYEAEDSKEHTVPAFNILHSNIEITVPSLFNSTPIPDIRRRFGDADEMGKQIVDVLERALSYSVDQYDFDGTVLEAVRDAELVGRGIARIRYNPKTTTQKDAEGKDYEAVGYQEITCEHVTWDKWGHGPARHWAECPWVYFEHDLTHDDLKKLSVKQERINALTFSDAKEKKGGDLDREKASSGVLKTVRAYEIWDKASKTVKFVAEQDKKEFLAEQPDPLQLEQFFPIPKAMQPLRKRRNITPLVPYKIYETQVAELDKVTKRINSLVGQLKVRGLYDSRMSAAFEKLRHCEDGQYEPAEDATIFAQGSGGLEKAIAHWPLAEIIAALAQLYIQRDQIKQVIYEITGLSDVLRGATDPNETLGAQQLKAQQGSTRLSQRQRMVSDFCRSLLRMKAEIIANHFTIENLSAITSMQIAPEVEQLLRSDQMRAYRIDIETDSTVRADVARAQEQMSLFLQGTAQYISAMQPIIEQEPGAKGPILEIYSAFARHFKLGKSAEDALDKMIQAASQPQEPKPDPEQQKLEAEMAAEQQKMQMQAQAEEAKGQREMTKMQAELQFAQQKAEIEMQLKQLEMQVRERLAELEIQKAEMEFEMKQRTMQLDQQAQVFDFQSRQRMSEVDIESRREKASADGEAREMKMHYDAKDREAKAKQMDAGE